MVTGRSWGRKSVDIIKSGGYKISALEVENALLHHSLIQECAVIGLRDAVWGERVCAVVTLEKEQDLSLQDLRSWSKERLAPYKVPQPARYPGFASQECYGKGGEASAQGNGLERFRCPGFRCGEPMKI